MKKRSLYLMVLVAALAATGCRQRIVTDDMPDNEKLEILDLQAEKHPDDASIRAQRAQVLLNLGRSKEALLDIGKAVSLEPENADYLMLEADVYFACGNIGESYKALTEAERLRPESTEVQLKQGEITFYSRDYERSMRHLSAVTEREPDNRTALFMKGFIYKEQGDTTNAIGLLRRVCDLYPDYEPAFEELGIIYSSRNLPLAEEYLNTAIRLEPSNTNAIYALAMYYQNIDALDQAEALYKRLIDINPASSDAWHNLGYMELFRYRDYERAVEYFTKAIEADENNVAALTNRGCAYELSDNASAARADFNAALAIDPSYQPALDGLKRLK